MNEVANCDQNKKELSLQISVFQNDLNISNSKNVLRYKLLSIANLIKAKHFPTKNLLLQTNSSLWYYSFLIVWKHRRFNLWSHKSLKLWIHKKFCLWIHRKLCLWTLFTNFCLCLFATIELVFEFEVDVSD